LRAITQLLPLVTNLPKQKTVPQGEKLRHKKTPGMNRAFFTTMSSRMRRNDR
jgi:hypothetical protein